jgi:hypothetical protein
MEEHNCNYDHNLGQNDHLYCILLNELKLSIKIKYIDKNYFSKCDRFAPCYIF